MEPALMALQSLCERSWELQPLCETLLGRLVALCGYTDHFRAQEPLPDNTPSDAELQWPAQVDAALSRFTHLLESQAATENAVFRLVVAPAPVREIRAIHTWLDASFRGLHAEHVDPSAGWAQEWEESLERADQALQIAAKMEVDSAGDTSDREQLEMLAAVKFAYQQVQRANRRIAKQKANRSASNSGSSAAEMQADGGVEFFPDYEESLRVLFRKLVRVGKVQVPVLPQWFLSPAEVAINPTTRFRGGPKSLIASATWMRTRGLRKDGVQQLLIKELVLDSEIETEIAAAVEVMQQEAELLQNCSRDPHVLRLVGGCTFGPHPFLAFENPWAAPECGAVLTSIEDYLNLSVDHRRQVFRLLAQTASGLKSMHAESLVHGDICCANILVGDDSQARLANVRSFSLARSSSEVSASNAAGSLRWQAPELLKSDAKTDMASDIYALGMTLLEAISGELPWGFLADDEVRERALRGEMPLCPVGVDDSVWSLVEAMCDADRAARPEIDTVVEELQALAEEERERDGDDTSFEKDTTPPLPLPRITSADYLRAASSSFAALSAKEAPINPNGASTSRRQNSPKDNKPTPPPAVGIPVQEPPQPIEREPPIPKIAVVELQQKWLGVKINAIGNRVAVSKFLRTESGAAGEIEASGRVSRGDVIVGINGQNVRGLDRLQVGAIVQSSSRPLEVSFERDPKLLTDSFRFRGLPMDPRWRDRGSALPLPGSLNSMLTCSGESSRGESQTDATSAEPFSIEIWFSLAELGDTFMGGVLLGAQDLPFQETSDSNGWPYVHHQLLAVDPMGNLWCSFLNRTTPVCVARELSLTHWYHLVVTYGGDADSDRATFSRNDQPEQLLTVYLNGEQRLSDAGPLCSAWPQLRYVNVGSGCISGMNPAKPESHFQGWFGFSGLVFDLRVWQRRELTATQVQLLFRGSSDLVDQPGYSLRRDFLGEEADPRYDSSRPKRSSPRSRLQGPPFAELVRTSWPHQVGAQIYS